MKTLFVRKDKKITTLAQGDIPAQTQEFPSINAAKRESRRLQGMKLGQGVLKRIG